MENSLKVADKVLVWEAEEFEHRPKTAVWYIGFTVVSAGLIIFGLFSKSPMTIILFGLIIVMTFLYAHRRPRVVLHQLTATGIVLGNTMYPYKEIKKFWIIYEPPTVKTLNLETTTYLNSHVVIQLGRQDPVQVKLFLKKYLVEDLNREESLADILARLLKL